MFQTTRKTAVKSFYDPAHYRHELEIYQYLKQWEIKEVAGFHIPELIKKHDSLKIIEMTVVSPPFIVDFVGAQIEIPFEREEGWVNEMKNLFEQNWDRVKMAIWGLEEHGVYLSDIHPGNIRY